MLWGGTVVRMRMNLADASSSHVRELLAQAWRRRAPKPPLKATTP
jgi:hypothetical protein